MCIFVHHLCWHQKPLSRLYDLTLTVAMIPPITCQQICKPLWFNQSPVSKYANHCDLTNHLSANPSDSTNHLRQTTCKIKTCSFHYLHSWPPVNLFQVNDSEGGGVGGWGRGGRGEKQTKKHVYFSHDTDHHFTQGAPLTSMRSEMSSEKYLLIAELAASIHSR